MNKAKLGAALALLIATTAGGGNLQAAETGPSSAAARPLVETGNRFDLAIAGDGFIEVKGQQNELLLWRGGRLKVDDTGSLATETGFPLRAGIVVPVDSTRLEIAADGAVRSVTWDGAVTVIGQIVLAKGKHPAALRRLENGCYAAPGAVELDHQRPGEGGTGTLVQGAIESE